MLLSRPAAHAATEASGTATPTRRERFRAWRRQRPFVGGLLTALGGVEMFFSGQLDLGRIHVQLGIEGLQATVIPVVLVLLGVLAVAMPAHRIFYGVIALAVAVYSLIGVNLGGFFVGMLLSSVGGVLTVAWMQRGATRAPEPEGAPGPEAVPGLAAVPEPEAVPKPEAVPEPEAVPGLEQKRDA